MELKRNTLRAANALVSMVTILALLLCGAYAAYALWDNNQVYQQAEDVQIQMLELKPEITEDGGASFEELLAINPDVCAWLTVDNTAIDYPILQGATNNTYINTDVYGNFALAGSIFLDSRNDRTFSEPYNLLYGHHMADSRMFGDLDLFKEEAFFEDNKTGTLILPDRAFDLEIFSCLIIGASEDAIFDPTLWQEDIEGLLQYAKENALYLDESAVSRIEAAPGDVQILAMSTCSTEFTDARTIVLAEMKPHQSAE